MSVFVVARHLGGGGQSLTSTADWKRHVFTASDFVNFHVLSLAVPSFSLISNDPLADAARLLSQVWKDRLLF